MRTKVKAAEVDDGFVEKVEVLDADEFSAVDLLQVGDEFEHTDGKLLTVLGFDDLDPAIYVFVDFEARDIPVEVIALCQPGSHVLMVDPYNTFGVCEVGIEVTLRNPPNRNDGIEGLKARIKYMKTQMDVEGW